MHFPPILRNHNGMTAYICRRFIPTAVFLVILMSYDTEHFANYREGFASLPRWSAAGDLSRPYTIGSAPGPRWGFAPDLLL